MCTKSTRALLWILGVSSFLTAEAWGQTYYRLTDIGDLPGGYHGTRATDMNDAAQVVGCSVTMVEGRGVCRAFLWQAGTMLDLGDLPGGAPESWAEAINNAGHVVGYSTTSGDLEMGFLWNGTMVALPPRAGWTQSRAFDINSQGDIVGIDYDIYIDNHAVLWSAGTVRYLGDLPGGTDQSTAFGINDLGQIVGYSSASGGYYAFLWEGGRMVPLGVLPGGFDSAIANRINNLGRAVGRDEVDGGILGALWIGRTAVRALKDQPGEPLHSEALDINDHGVVVGFGRGTRPPGAPVDQRAVLWKPDGSLVDLMSRIHPGDPLRAHVHLYYAKAINAHGQILVNGIDLRAPSESHAYVMTPD
jgi:probable HAF family extracellular repeat protein